MCEYCQDFPHRPGCPNAPDPEPVRCPVCGRMVDGVGKGDVGWG